MLDNVINNIVHLIDNTDNDSEAVKHAKNNVTSTLKIFVGLLKKSQYAASHKYTIVDVMLSSILFYVIRYKIELPIDNKVLLEYAKRMFARTSFQKSVTHFQVR